MLWYLKNPCNGTSKREQNLAYFTKVPPSVCFHQCRFYATIWRHAAATSKESNKKHLFREEGRKESLRTAIYRSIGNWDFNRKIKWEKLPVFLFITGFLFQVLLLSFQHYYMQSSANGKDNHLLSPMSLFNGICYVLRGNSWKTGESILLEVLSGLVLSISQSLSSVWIWKIYIEQRCASAPLKEYVNTGNKCKSLLQICLHSVQLTQQLLQVAIK